MEHESEGDTNCSRCSSDDPQRIAKGTEWLKIQRSGNHSDDSIIKIGQDPGKSPGDLKRLAAIQNPVKKHPLMLEWKTPKVKE